MRRSRGLVPLGVFLFAVLAAFGVELHDAQRESHRSAERRFEQRAQISAALTQSVFGTLGSLSSDELAAGTAARRHSLERRLGADARAARLAYAAVVGPRGAVLAHAGKAQPAPRGRAARRARLSDARDDGAGPLIDFGLPFKARDGTGAGSSRAFQ